MDTLILLLSIPLGMIAVGGLGIAMIGGPIMFCVYVYEWYTGKKAP